MIAQVCADREFIGTVGQLYLFAAQEVALIEVTVVPRFVLTAGAGDKYSEIIFQRVAQIYRTADSANNDRHPRILVCPSAFRH